MFLCSDKLRNYNWNLRSERGGNDIDPMMQKMIVMFTTIEHELGHVQSEGLSEYIFYFIF
jgi:hypothetical protein